MPFVPNTPESHAAILSPPTPETCCGVSNDGKPCKRTLVRNSAGQPQSGVITIVGKSQAYFCGRHQEQAKTVVLRHTASFARRRALVGRGSLDTLIEQVEVLVGGENKGDSTVKTTIVSTTQKVRPHENDPFKPKPEDYDEEEATGFPAPPSPPGAQHGGKQKKRVGFLKRLLMGCCGCSSDDDPEDEKNWSPARKAAELRSAAAKVVDETFPRPHTAEKKKQGKTVAFQSTAPTPPLPMMYPPKTPQSAITKPAASAMRPAMGLSPASAVTPQSSDDDVEAVVPPMDVSSLPKAQQDRNPPYSRITHWTG
jgi:hypothetical protein